VWKELAALYQELGAVTWTEEAARSAGGVADAEAWARATRARYGIAPGGPVTPEAEADYVQEVRGLLELVYEQRFAEADKRAARLRRRFGDTAGLRASLCDLEIRRRRYPQARAQCAAALKSHADTSWAHYLTGLLDQRDKKEDAALQHLERAIALDAELKHAYQVAAEMYKAKGRAADEKRVRDAFQKQFGRPLP
jgi:tetratricopeptide (TPR) repeat protein